MPEPLLTTLSGVALKKLLEGIVSAASEPLKKKLKYIQNEDTQKKIFKAISSVGKVKTMCAMDSEVKLLPIYYPTDAESLWRAQQRLGHADSKIIERVYRRKPETVRPYAK
jgi:hypothetical protein